MSVDTRVRRNLHLWGRQKHKESNEGGVQAITSAFTHYGNSVASAFFGSDGKAETSVSTTSSSLPHGISPGRIELQEKLFNQTDMLHRMYE